MRIGSARRQGEEGEENNTTVVSQGGEFTPTQCSKKTFSPVSGHQKRSARAMEKTSLRPPSSRLAGMRRRKNKEWRG